MKRLSYVLCILLFTPLVNVLWAQEQVRFPATVNAIAGTDIFLPIGTSSGIIQGDTLQIFAENTYRGSVYVKMATATRLVATFVDTPFVLKRGDPIEVVFQRHELPRASVPVSPDSASVITPERTSLLDEPSSTDLKAIQKRLNISGRFSFGLHYLQSTTRPGQSTDSAIRRTHQIPFASLRTTVENLPSDLRLDVNVRYTYRRSERRKITPAESFRIYQLSLSKPLSSLPADIRVGRFHNPYESFSGYWDGVLIGIQGAAFGGGVAGGVQPQRGNEWFTTSLPKYTVYSTYAYLGEQVRYNAQASFNQVLPSNQLLNHTFIGIAQTLRWSRQRIRSRLQLDQDPRSGKWMVTRFQFNGTLPLHRRLSLRTRYSFHQPYQLWRTDQIIGYQRRRIGAGGTLNLRSTTLSTDFTLNQTDRDGRSRTMASYLNIPRTGLLNVGLMVSSSYWVRGDDYVFQIQPALSRRFGNWTTQVRYRYDRNQFQDVTTIRQGLDLSLNIPISRRIRTSILLQTQTSQRLTSNRIYLAGWIRL